MPDNSREYRIVEDEGRVEIEELDPERFISIEMSRRWPKYVATWSVRRRSGDTDFPMASGEVERMPAEGVDPWEDLRAQSLLAARVAAQQTEPPPKKRSIVSRLFNRG